jgi:hypothetical protein
MLHQNFIQHIMIMTHMSSRTVWVRSTRCEASQHSWIPPSYSSTAVTYPGHTSNLTTASVFIALVMDEWINIEHWWNYADREKNLSIHRKKPIQVSLSTTNPTWTGLGFNHYYIMRSWRLTARAMAQPGNIKSHFWLLFKRKYWSDM